VASFPARQQSPYASQCSQMKLLPISDELCYPRQAL